MKNLSNDKNHANSKNKSIVNIYVQARGKTILPKCGVDVPVMISSCICSFSYSRSLYRKMNPKKHTFVFSHEHQDELMNIKKSNQMAKL